MNEDELKRNVALTEWTVKDLNAGDMSHVPLSAPPVLCLIQEILLSKACKYCTAVIMARYPHTVHVSPVVA